MPSKQIYFYANCDYTGTEAHHIYPGEAVAAPHPGHEQRQVWKPNFAPFGPIGFILVQLHEKGAGMTAGYILHLHGWPALHVLDCPHQELKPADTHLANQARTEGSINQRKSNIDLQSIDKLATNASDRRLMAGEKRLLKMVQQGASFDRRMTSRFGFHFTNCCEPCEL